MSTVSMSSRWATATSWALSHNGKKLIRFALTSVVSTLFSEGVILVVYGLTLTHSPMWATAIGNLSAMPPAYYLTRRWAWGKSGASHWRKEVVPFTVLNLLGLAVALLGATYCRHIVYTHHLTHLVNTVLVAGVNLVSFAVFWVFKILLFNKIFHTTPIALYEEHLTLEEQA